MFITPDTTPWSYRSCTAWCHHEERGPAGCMFRPSSYLEPSASLQGQTRRVDPGQHVSGAWNGSGRGAEGGRGAHSRGDSNPRPSSDSATCCQPLGISRPPKGPGICHRGHGLLGISSTIGGAANRGAVGVVVSAQTQHSLCVQCSHTEGDNLYTLSVQ